MYTKFFTYWYFKSLTKEMYNKTRAEVLKDRDNTATINSNSVPVRIMMSFCKNVSNLCHYIIMALQALI